MALPDDYLALLAQLAIALGAYERQTGHAPILVGGAAVAIQTQGSFMSGDLDLYAPDDETLHKCLLDAGFVPEERVGRLRGGYFHPDFRRYGVEAISGGLFDGRSDRDRLMRVTFDENLGIVIPAYEDMIADRLGQHAVASASDDSRLRQAQLLFRLAEKLDLDYLQHRVEQEGGDYRLLTESRTGGEG